MGIRVLFNYELHELNKWAYAFLIISNYTNFSIWGSAFLINNYEFHELNLFGIRVLDYI